MFDKLFFFMDNIHMGKDGKACTCMHHHMLALLVTLFGVVFLFGDLGWIPGQMVNVIWPLILVIGGIGKMLEGRCKC